MGRQALAHQREELQAPKLRAHPWGEGVMDHQIAAPNQLALQPTQALTRIPPMNRGCSLLQRFDGLVGPLLLKALVSQGQL